MQTTKNRHSYQFTKFVFSVVLKQLREPEIILKFDTPNFIFRPSGLAKESTRNLLKYLDFDYPRNEAGEPLSYSKLTNQDMTRHVQWIERTASYNGFTLRYIDEEWTRLMAQIRN